MQKKELKSVGIPLGPAGCIIIGNILVENMPKEKLLALSEHCLKSHRIFESKLLCFFGLSGITIFFLFFLLNPFNGLCAHLNQNSPISSNYTLLVFL